MERERLQQEKAERHRVWNMETNQPPDVQPAGKVRLMSDMKYSINRQEEKPSSVPFPLSDFSQPLHVETDRQIYTSSGGLSPMVQPSSPRKTVPIQPLAKNKPAYASGQYSSLPREYSPPEKLEPNLHTGHDKRVIDSVEMSRSKSENWMDVNREPVQTKDYSLQIYASDAGVVSKSTPAIAKKPLLLKKEPVSSGMQYGGPPGNYENVYRGENSDSQQRNRKNGQKDDELRRYSYAPEATSVAAAREEAMRVSRRPRSSHDDSSPVSFVPLMCISYQHA